MKNKPLVIKKSVNFNSVTIRSFWDVNGDESYKNIWPRDRKLPFAENTLVAVYTKKGNGIIDLCDGKQLKIRGSTLVFIEPKSILSYWCDGLIWDLFWIEIYIDPKLKNLVQHNKVIQIDNLRHFEIQLEELLHHFGDDKDIVNYYAAALFNKIFFEWLLVTNTEQHSKSYKNVKCVIEEMHHQLSTNWKVKSMANFVGCSEQHLRKQFIEHTKRSPKDYYSQLKLDIALGVLKRGNKTISQVAYELGYSDAFHFSNVFKKRFGYAPSSVTPINISARQLITSSFSEE